jgi:ferredoxin
MTSMSGDLSLLAAARTAALSASEAIRTVDPEWISFTSRGVVLVTGKAARVMTTLTKLCAPIRVVAFVPDAPHDAVVPGNVRLIVAPVLSLAGYLGRFSATSVPVNGEPVDAGRFGWNEDRRFDLILDLNDVPLLPHEVGPYGYFAPRTEDELAAALVQMREQPSTWRKPRYFDYRTAMCAHGAAGVVGCTRCLDACPAGAIAGAGDKVAFDPFLCHGCGTCAAVCPEGAVRYAYPPADTSLERLRVMLGAWFSTGASHPRLIVFVASGSTVDDETAFSISAVCLPYSVPALATFGIEMWFAALAWGAAQIVLVPNSTTAQASLNALNEELLVARAILSALGEAPDRIVLAESTQTVPAPPPGKRSAIAGALSKESKRSTLYAALDHLSQSGTRSNQTVRLPLRASLGSVEVNQDLCTVCFACVNLCPTHALTSADSSTPELRLTESRCVQCGLCEHGCPERAISLVPQINLDRAERESPRVLCVDQSFQCVRCGAPFISKRMLARSMELMKDHPLLQQEGIERLKLCMTCRAQATMLDVMPDGG